VDVAGPGATVIPLFLRYDPADADDPRDPWTLRREAVVYLALQDQGLAVPRVLAVHPVHQAMLAERVNGDNWFSRIQDPVEAERTAQDFMVQLAALHRIDPGRLDLPGFPPPTSIPDLVHHELDELHSILIARGGIVEPALDFALGWLRHHVPDHAGPVVLVQGDTGPGNFMFAGGRVVAVVDWELAHLGDPMDDIAWLSLRAVQEPFTHLPTRLAEYEALSGDPIDLDRVHYYQVMAETKLQVMRHHPDGEGPPATDLGNYLIYGVLHKRLWMEALGRVLGLEPEVPDGRVARDRREHQWLYDAILEQLRTSIVPRIEDPFARTRTKGLARVVKYLRDVDRHGALYEQDELDDAAGLLGADLGSLPAAREAMVDAHRRGTIDDTEYLRYLWRRVGRDNELLRSASGALADRHWPALVAP